MARRNRSKALDPFADLDRKAAVLERELSTQRQAMARLQELARKSVSKSQSPTVRRPVEA